MFQMQDVPVRLHGHNRDATKLYKCHIVGNVVSSDLLQAWQPLPVSPGFSRTSYIDVVYLT